MIYQSVFFSCIAEIYFEKQHDAMLAVKYCSLKGELFLHFFQKFRSYHNEIGTQNRNTEMNRYLQRPQELAPAQKMGLQYFILFCSVLRH